MLATLLQHGILQYVRGSKGSSNTRNMALNIQSESEKFLLSDTEEYDFLLTTCSPIHLGEGIIV